MNLWPYKWFGFWKEYGDDYCQFPSVFEFIDIKANSEYDKRLLIPYLKEAVVVAATSASAFPSPITAKENLGAAAIRSDGVWIWLDTIVNLVEHDNLALPWIFYEHIKFMNFNLPTDIDIDFDQFQWPSL